MVERLRITWLLARANIRSQLTYRASFAADLVSRAFLAATDFLELYVLLHVAPVFGQMKIPQALLVFALAYTSFALVDFVFGQVDRVNDHIKAGTLDVLLTRPASLLLQLTASQMQVRRLGALVATVPILVVGVVGSRIELNPRNLTLLTLAIVGGFLIMSSVFVFAGATLFFILDGNQAVNAFVYGGNYAAKMPGATLMTPVRELFTFVVPATLVAYVPAAVLTGAPLPTLWSPMLAWLTVPIGIAMWVAMLVYWRIAIRHYTSAGG